jgi:predicted RNA-binding Zn-ribbon protein involved in translation (DUF1610 family)
VADPDKPPTTPAVSLRCPHCEYPQLIQISASEVVAIYKCPNCGELIAPVKSEKR